MATEIRESKYGSIKTSMAPETSDTFMSKLKHFFMRNSLPILLILGVIFGVLVPQPGVALNHKATTYVCLCVIFLYSGLYLPSGVLKSALSAYKAFVWSLISILFITSTIGAQLTNVVDFKSLFPTGNTPNELQTAFMMYLCAPCTVSSGVLMVQQLKGNCSLAILLTVIVNIAGIFTAPLLLKWMLFNGEGIQLDVLPMLMNLLLSLLLPLVIGKLLTFIKKVDTFIQKSEIKLVLKLASVTSLALIICIKVSQSSHNNKLQKISVLAIMFIVGWALTTHTLFLITNTLASFALRLEKDQLKCVVILCSQKTAAIAVSTLMFLPTNFGDKGLMAVVVVIGHISVLVFDSIMISLWSHCENNVAEDPTD